MNGNRNSDQRGIALIAALMVMLLMSALLIGFTTIVMSDQRFRGIDKDRNRAYYGAQSGLEKLTVDLGNLFLANVAPTAQQIANLSNNPPAIANVSFAAAAPLVPYGATLLTCDNQGNTTCNGTIQNGPYQGLIALKKVYGLDAIAKTSGGGEVHLTRKVESVAIPVFQFGTFSDVDLTFFAGANFSIGGRIHTNGNLFLAAQDNGTTTLTDKVTAVGDFIRARMQNGLPIGNGFNGTIRAATAPNNFRALQVNEGSLIDGVGSAPNNNWSNISLTTYNGYIRDGGCPPPGPPAAPCPVPDRGTGAKRLELALVTPGVGGSNPDLVRRPPPGEDVNKPVLFGERLYGKVSLRILMSDTPADILNLPTVTATAPVRLGDDAGAGLTNDWAVAGNAPAGYGPVDATHPPIARSPGVQTVQTMAATPLGGLLATSINVAIPAAGLAGAYHSPGDLGNNGDPLVGTIEILNNNAPFPPTHRVYIDCQSITPTQFKSCRNHTAANALPVVPNNSFISITESGVNYLVTTAGDGGQAAGATADYTVTSAGGTSAFASNTFWMQSTNNPPLWSVVTCTGVNSNTNNPGNLPVFGGPVRWWTNCAGVPNIPTTNAGVNTITSAQLVAQNVGTIGGYIKIEIQKADHTWQDVTTEILNWGFGSVNQDGQLCDDPSPNAIVRIQRLRDNGGTCHYSKSGANGVAVSTNSYDYWPQTIFDTREALLREPSGAAPAPAQSNILLGGVMHYVALDVGNLKKWFARQAPYGASSGNLVLLDNNGYSVYFSDRRNNRDLNSLETGEYGWEDVVNPGDPTGQPNGQLDAGEDFNGNGLLETYGQFPNFLGVRNALPPGPVAPFNIAGNITPLRTLGRAAAMTSRAYLFRRALKLVDASAGNVPMPGFTVISENPVYVHGDYNWSAAALITDPHSETAVIADAVTLLSNAWVDANAFRNPYDATQRVRQTNWYRLAIIGGKPPAFPWPNAGNPNATFGTDGGAHNFLRYLETGNAPLTTNFLGSIATFYYSRQATGTYKFGASGVYSAPNRNYNFDTDFLDPAKLPPLTPMFRDINALGFTQETRPGH